MGLSRRRNENNEEQVSDAEKPSLVKVNPLPITQVGLYLIHPSRPIKTSESSDEFGKKVQKIGNLRRKK